MLVYLAASALGHLLWEIAQLPFYTIWADGGFGQIGFAVLHCTAGDVLIAATALVLAQWAFAPVGRRVVGATLVIGAAYTAGSEYVHAVIRTDWPYSQLMPTLPILGIGALPMAQWLVIPAIALHLAHRQIAAFPR